MDFQSIWGPDRTVEHLENIVATGEYDHFENSSDFGDFTDITEDESSEYSESNYDTDPEDSDDDYPVRDHTGRVRIFNGVTPYVEVVNENARYYEVEEEDWTDDESFFTAPKTRSRVSVTAAEDMLPLAHPPYFYSHPPVFSNPFADESDSPMGSSPPFSYSELASESSISSPAPMDARNRELILRLRHDESISPRTVTRSPNPFSNTDVESIIRDCGPIFEDHNNHKFSHEDRYPSPVYIFEPHRPNRGCHCHWCVQYRTGAPSAPHDPMPWCYCVKCQLFRSRQQKARRKAEEAERQRLWDQQIHSLYVKAKEARRDEEKRLIDLMDFEAERRDDVFSNHSQAQRANRSSLFQAVKDRLRAH